MKVKELIILLQQQDPEANVTTEGCDCIGEVAGVETEDVCYAGGILSTTLKLTVTTTGKCCLISKTTGGGMSVRSPAVPKLEEMGYTFTKPPPIKLKPVPFTNLEHI